MFNIQKTEWSLETFDDVVELNHNEWTIKICRDVVNMSQCEEEEEEEEDLHVWF